MGPTTQRDKILKLINKTKQKQAVRSRLLSKFVCAVDEKLAGAASEGIGRLERSVTMPTLMKWKASLMIMANVTIMSSIMFPPCIAGGNIFFAHLY